MKKAVVVGGLAAVTLVAAAFAGVGVPEQASGEDEGARTITVSGTGLVEVAPNEAAFSFGVETRAASARDASAENAAAMRQLIGALKGAGVAADKLRTEHVSLWPTGKPDGGYTASSSVNVSTSVERAGALVDVATAAGATTLAGPTLTRTESHTLEEQALERALDDARRKARVLADAAGAQLGDAVRLVEGGDAEPLPEYGRALADTAQGAPPIEPGTVERRATLTVTFALA